MRCDGMLYSIVGLNGRGVLVGGSLQGRHGGLLPTLPGLRLGGALLEEEGAVEGVHAVLLEHAGDGLGVPFGEHDRPRPPAVDVLGGYLGHLLAAPLPPAAGAVHVLHVQPVDVDGARLPRHVVPHQLQPVPLEQEVGRGAVLVALLDVVLQQVRHPLGAQPLRHHLLAAHVQLLAAGGQGVALLVVEQRPDELPRVLLAEAHVPQRPEVPAVGAPPLPLPLHV
mmetsp:Transcript_31839/g.89202  ORF Transcript_31839/g.89202 Transcript_31839/m.89202 type:complete len:224 (+) Transcript_31839:37-708(+)